ncbi:MAG: response regulator [Mariprofundaceae bacterium]
MPEAKRILIVDDDPQVLKTTVGMVRAAAKKLGIPVEIDETSDPIHVLYDLVYQARDDYDLVMLDIRMPKVCGEEIFRSMQLMDSKLQERVVFVTGYAEDLNGAVFGVRLRVIEKPFRLEAVENMLVHVLGLEGAEARPEPWTIIVNDPH